MPGRRAQGLFRKVAAHGVVDDVDALAVSQCLDRVLERTAGVVDDIIGACLPGECQFLIGAGRGNNPGAERFCQFDGGVAHAARSAEHEHGLAALQPGALLERVVARAVSDGIGCAFLETHALRQRYGHVLVDDGLLGKRAAAQGADDAIAGFESRDVATDGRDNAGRLVTGYERQGRAHLVLARDDQDVGEVQARRFDVEGHLAIAGHGVVPILDD